MLVFDPFLVRGMGYYTGTIFEIEHPDFSFSLGGGGRYDGMIGRFLGEEVPACGFSIGFERIIDLIADPAAVLVFDPFLVRGMGYYTGTIFEIEHPDFGYSLGGGGRYDGMIGRFLGQDVPAAGFSIGFERIVDLVEADASGAADQVVLVHDADAQPAQLALLKTALVAAGKRVRLERRTKNLKATLDRVEAAGFGAFAFVGRDTSTVDQLEFKPLG